jgi:peptidoglycan/xylan/chitin deacetylase (PgdA/CDA1 family)
VPKRTLFKAIVLVLVAAIGLFAVPSSSAQQTPVREISTSYKKIVSCNMPGKEVWITFDDAGTPSQVKGILRVLRERNVRAIFFPVGYFAQNNPRLIAKITRQGHYLGNHSYSHMDFTQLSNNSIRSEIERGAQGTTSPMLLRPPYGAGTFEPRVQSVASSLGYQMCFWTVDTRDWAGASANQIVSRVRFGEAGITPPIKKNGVIVLHMQAPHTVEALPGVIDAILERGLTLPQLVE